MKTNMQTYTFYTHQFEAVKRFALTQTQHGYPDADEVTAFAKGYFNTIKFEMKIANVNLQWCVNELLKERHQLMQEYGYHLTSLYGL
jgi:hypothetical protein